MFVVTWLRSITVKKWVVDRVASIAYRWSARKRRLTERAVSQAMASADLIADHEGVVRGAFREFWRETFSLVLMPAERRALRLVAADGLEHLREAVAGGRGVILSESSNFGRRLIAKQILQDHGFSIHQVHAQLHVGGFAAGGVRSRARSILKVALTRLERETVAGIIDIPDSHSLAYAREIVRLLAVGGIVCIAGDGRFGQRLLSVPFLGGVQPFATGVINLARVTGAALLPMFCVEEPDESVRFIIEPPVSVGSRRDKQDVIADAINQYAALLDSYIRRYPTQYRGWHLLAG